MHQSIIIPSLFKLQLRPIGTNLNNHKVETQNFLLLRCSLKFQHFVLTTKQTDVLPPDLATYRSLAIRVLTSPITLKFDGHLGSFSLPICLSNFRAKRSLQHPIPQLRDFTRYCANTSYRLVNRDPASSWLLFCSGLNVKQILSYL